MRPADRSRTWPAENALLEYESVAPFRSRDINRRTFLNTALGTALGAGLGTSLRTESAGALGLSLATDAVAAPGGTVLYNGIRLADPWPPDWRTLPERPISPPYLVAPPEVIPIDIGRQLFVDDFLIQETSLERTFHRTHYYEHNPVLRPTTKWENFDEYAKRTKTHSNPAAMVFSDGVFYDPSARLFKMWYMGGYAQNTCYATSSDGITWDKPALDVTPGTNIVWSGLRDSSTVWLDHDTTDPRQRFKMALYNGSEARMLLYVSPDGIHWGDIAAKSGPSGDRTTFFYNPFRKVWVFSLRNDVVGYGRARSYWETADFVGGSRWVAKQPALWTSADSGDPRRPDYLVRSELYNLDCVAYESLMIGLFTIFRGEHEDREKPNEVTIGFSRDGFHWSRQDREAFIPVSEHVGDWNWANVQSAGGCCLVVRDALHFYVSGRHGVPGTSAPGVCSTGLATLRRDGFVSMDHSGSGDHPGSGQRVERIGGPPGTLVTRPVRFSGRYLFVNVDASAGGLQVEVLDRDGRVIEPYSQANCSVLRTNSTRARVTWSAAPDLARLAGEAVRFRFHLERGQLYAFWVSASTSGASRGYVAAGGPGFPGAIDTVGDAQ
jgi:hypothetical protein